MENNQEPVTQTEEKTEATVTESVEKTEKTFTQDEVNAMLSKERNKVSKKYEGVDLKKYKEWEESQKTEAEKQAEVLKENETLKSRISELENMQVVANAGVDSKFQKFVLSEVSTEGDFEENLKDYLKNNSQFLVQDITPENKDTGVNVSKIDETAESGVTAILKQKHPELFK